jgi:hypothetical protein
MQQAKQEPGLGCQRHRPSDIIYCAAAGYKITMATARANHHYRAGDFSGDHPKNHPAYAAPVRPDNAATCGNCRNCED